MSRTPIIAGNWKLHMNPEQTTEFVDAVKDKLPDPSKVESLICAPAVDLDALRKAAKGSNLHIGAENCYFEDEVLTLVKLHLRSSKKWVWTT